MDLKYRKTGAQILHLFIFHNKIYLKPTFCLTLFAPVFSRSQGHRPCRRSPADIRSQHFESSLGGITASPDSHNRRRLLCSPCGRRRCCCRRQEVKTFHPHSLRQTVIQLSIPTIHHLKNSKPTNAGTSTVWMAFAIICNGNSSSATAGFNTLTPLKKLYINIHKQS